MQIFRHLGLVIVVLFLAVCGCSRAPVVGPTTRMTLNVFAAASLTESFRDIAGEFEAEHPGVTVNFNFGGSQQLLSQLQNGATADLFASASPKEMDAAKANGIVDPTSEKVFAHNRLVVILPPHPTHAISSMTDLVASGVKIDVADPSVPVGAYTMKMLAAMDSDPSLGVDYQKHFLANVVSRENNVKAVVAKVTLGEADAGVVYVSDAGNGSNVTKLDVPDRYNQVASYPMAIIAHCPNSDLANAFEIFALSDRGQAILAKHGFISALPGK